jgi:hypothetical protein
MVGEEWNFEFLVNLPLTDLPRWVSYNKQTCGLQKLQFPDISEDFWPPDGASIILHRTDELLAKQHTVSEGQTTYPIKKCPASYATRWIITFITRTGIGHTQIQSDRRTLYL